MLCLAFSLRERLATALATPPAEGGGKILKKRRGGALFSLFFLEPRRRCRHKPTLSLLSHSSTMLRATSFLALLQVVLVALAVSSRAEPAPAAAPSSSSVTSTLSAAGQNPNGSSFFPLFPRRRSSHIPKRSYTFLARARLARPSLSERLFGVGEY